MNTTIALWIAVAVWIGTGAGLIAHFLRRSKNSVVIPPLGREKARVFMLNLRNRLIFKAANEEGALESADFIGKAKAIKKSWGYSNGKMSRNYSELEEHRIKPHILRTMAKHAAVIVHCERGHRRKLLPPLEPDGSVAPWFRGHWLS